MNHLYKGKAKYISAWIPLLLLMCLALYGNGTGKALPHFHSNLTNDTVPLKPEADTTVKVIRTPNKTINNRNAVDSSTLDTVYIPKVDSFSVRTSKGALDAPVVYHADDSMILDVPAKKILLYGKTSSVKFTDNELIAPRIEYDQSSNLISAYMERDSNGNVISFPTFNQGTLKTVSDFISFNPKTGKGLTRGTYTVQGEMFVYAERIKKVTADVFYASKIRITTCNLDTPHFAFVSTKAKFINKKMAFTGPVHPEFEAVPIPVYLPFGIYPLRQGRHSGVLAPSFTANEQLGLALEGLGYYKVISDNWDVVTRGTIYSYGGWTASVSPRYYKRYHYQGNFSIDLQRFKDIDNSGTRNFNVRWSHAADVKRRPGVNFSANVNAGSSKFNSSIPNSPIRNIQNQLNSSITYAKVWKDRPYNLTVSANHNQNTNDSRINLNLPDVGFNVNTLYPFRRKELIGEYKWFENIGVALNTNAKSLTTFIDTAGQIGKQIADNLQYGASHNVPITLSLPEVAHIQFAPSISYQEVWYQRKTIRRYNPITKRDTADIQKGFFAAREMSFGISASTRIFGLFAFGKNSKVQAIRHEIRPVVGFSYHPDMNGKNYYSTQIDSFGTRQRFSVYEGNIYSAFSEGKSGSVNFSVDNNIQMKVRNRKDTAAGAIKKISILDGLSLSGSYNLLADSFRMSPYSVTARTNLFDKVNITANGNIDPYLTDDIGNRIDKLVISKRPWSLGKLSSGSVSIQSQFQGGDKKEIAPNTLQQQAVNPISGLPLNDYQQEAAYISNNPGEFANFNIPWSVNFSYSLNFYRQRRFNSPGFETVFSQNINWSGSLNLTPKWQIGLNGYFNITEKQLQTLTMYLSREMHCWQMAINIAPVGKFRFFNISISPKSGILRDLRINRTRYFYDF